MKLVVEDSVQYEDYQHVNSVDQFFKTKFMKYEEKWENLLFLGDEVELNWFLYRPIEYEIQKDELSYIIYDDKRIFDKIQISIDANVFTVETEEENK